MKKITSKKLTKRLAQYGALSVAVMGVADAAGQIVYTDLDPDQVLNVGDEFEIDYTGDAITNVNPSNPDGLAGGNAAIVFPSSGGAFVGMAAGGFQYPALMEEGDVIDSASGYTDTGARGDLNYYGCAYSNSTWCNDVTDGYLGVSFQFDGNTHYGWVRMDTDVDGDNIITIKDYAFESSPDTAIGAGDSGLGIEDEAFNSFEHFTSNEVLTLKAATAMENVTIYNINGQVVVNKALSSTTETVDLSAQATGVYIAKVTIDGAEKSFKLTK